jgi:hypothetical protein
MRKLTQSFSRLVLLSVSLLLFALPLSSSAGRQDCCTKCQERFDRCKKTTADCCEVYGRCIAQLPQCAGVRCIPPAECTQ